jgi:hypothetical protein
MEFTDTSFTVITAPSDIDIGETDLVMVSITVTADGTNRYWEFDMTVKLVSVNSMISVPSQVKFSNQRPSGSSPTYTWSKDVNFDITGIMGGTETLRAEATMIADHYGNNIKRTDTASVVVINDPPVLSSGSHEPPSGTVDTEFTFSVMYQDANGQFPTRIDLLLSGNPYPMSASDGNEDTMIDGEIYSKTMKLPWGDHEYHFETSDGSDDVRFPESGELTLPTIPQPNLPPSLDNPSLDPYSGYCNDTFRFSVTYRDDNGDLPAGEGLLLILDDIPHQTPLSPTGGNTSYLTDGDVTNGERYEISIQVDCGDHHYKFNVTDGEFFSEIGPISGPVVREEPYLDERIFTPEDGAEFEYNSSIYFSISSFSNFDIDNVTYSWNSNLSGSLGDERDFFETLPPGYHNITLTSTSTENGLVSTFSIHIGVLEEVIIPDEFAIVEYSPEEDQTLNEDGFVEFHVTLDLDVLPDIKETYWKLDDEIVDSGITTYRFETNYSSSGRYILEYIIMDETTRNIRESIQWTITVNDVKAPILIMEDLEEDLGIYNKRDLLTIKIPARDPDDRELTVQWRIDNRSFADTGLDLSVVLKQGPWAQTGNHPFFALIMNPKPLKEI